MEDSRSWKSSNSRQLHRHHSCSLTSLQEALASQQLSRTPSNETSLLINALVGKLKAPNDLRYDLSWTYGGFIEDIPRRIGTNEALDSAVAALVSSHSYLGSHRGTDSFNPIEGLTKYSRALKTLRINLNDPAIACKAETLCAVMLLLICQSFLGTYVGYCSSHGEGAAQILKVRAYYNTQDEFERKLLLTLRGPVLCEALINTRISFTSTEWRGIVENELDEASPEGLILRCLAHAPDLMQRGTTALREQAGLQMLISETRHQYVILTAALSELHDRLNSVKEFRSSPHSATPLTRAHSHYQRSYGLCLAICIVFNCILKALDTNDTNDTDLDVESMCFCEDVLGLAEEAAMYRPLGASYITLCLMAAWCGSRDDATRATVERILIDYRMDFPGALIEGYKVELEHTSQRLSLLDP